MYCQGRVPHATAADGTRIAYELCGREDGEPLVLIQGLERRPSGLAHAAGRPRRALPTCCWSTTAGWASRTDPPGPYDLNEMAEDVLAVMDEVGLGLGPRHGRIDGRGHRPDPRRAAPGPGPVAGPRLHRLSPRALAAGAARRLEGHRPRGRDADLRRAQRQVAGRPPLGAPLLADPEPLRRPGPQRRARRPSPPRSTPSSRPTSRCVTPSPGSRPRPWSSWAARTC